MARRRFRWRGWSLAARLLLVALVPTAFMVPLSVRDINASRATVTAADALADEVGLEREVAGVSAPAYIEYLAHVGLAAIDSYDVDRAVVINIVGIDYEKIYSDNRTQLDAQIEALLTDHSDLVLSTGVTLGVELQRLRLELDDQRLATDEFRGDPASVRRVFDDLDGVLIDAMTQKRLALRSTSIPGELEHFQSESTALNWVLRTAGDRGKAVLDSTTVAGDHLLPVAAAAASHTTANLELEALLPPRLAHSFTAVVDSGPDVVAELPAQPMVLAGFDLSDVKLSGSRVLGQLRYLDTLGTWAHDYYVGIADTSQSVSSDARQDRDQKTQLLVAIVLLGLLLVLWLSRSLLKPLFALGRRADEIGKGDLSHQPLQVSGPRDLRALTRTMNGMQQTLQLFEQQSAALASGHVDDASLAAAAPGLLGESIRSSVARLAEMTSQLRDSEARASAIVAFATVAIWTLDEDGSILSSTAAAQAALMVAADDQHGRNLEGMLGTLRGECEVIRRDGSKLSLDVDNTVVHAVGSWLRTVIAEDVTERKEFERRLHHQARHDTLTGLPNRFAVLERLGELTEAGRATAVLFVDIDGFKSVNDTQGHAVGDLVLAEIAVRLQAEVRAGAMVARLGGDEFVVVTEDLLDEREAVLLGRRLIERIEEPYLVGGSLFAISASVGVASIMRGDEPLDVIHRADSAVYQAKDRGRARVEVFNEAFQARIEQRAELERALRAALSQGELEMYLQPIFEIASGRPCGAEALARWNRPGVGFVPPSEFIPIAESSSLIFDLTRWMLLEACQRVVAWRQMDAECTLRISVNLSGRHLIDGDLIGDLSHALVTTGADPTMLELELTESQLLADLDAARVVLETVREMGITVAVDDFGTGSSSMAYLRQLPVDSIKVDRSFVSGTGRDGFDSSAIDAMVNFGLVLGVHVVAEGVETAQQLAHVQARGCTRAQGHLFGVALPADEVDVVLGLATLSPLAAFLADVTALTSPTHHR
ncbi:MAG: hypothetical protein JWN99_93 [Ilumatobacteraceae bacterium]|nr:hypothetical protein [Ilumatobacteraceae bacterium]